MSRLCFHRVEIAALRFSSKFYNNNNTNNNDIVWKESHFVSFYTRDEARVRRIVRRVDVRHWTLINQL